MTFFADFELEGQNFDDTALLTRRDLGKLYSRKYQNYPVLDNRSDNFSMIMNIKE